jgi:hypothetical protein
MGSNPIVASGWKKKQMSTFHWRETLKAIKPPFFTRLGCSLFVAVLTLHLIALLIAGVIVTNIFLVPPDDKESHDFYISFIRWTLILGPQVVLLF